MSGNQPFEHDLAASQEFRASRDFLFAAREDYEAAQSGFQWPDPSYFNWALDWFDAELATGASAGDVALKIVGKNAAELSFAELSQRSNGLANGLRRLGAKRGDRLLLMLGNRSQLWETMLAAMKLGLVTVPTTTLCTAEDVRERILRAKASFILVEADLADTLDGLPTDLVQITVGAAADGWLSYDSLIDDDVTFTASEATRPDEPILLYFTSGTTARPKLVLHSHRSYGIGALSTMYWLGLQPGDIHLNVSSPGWAKHAWSCFFAPWDAGATVFIANQGRFDARGLLCTLVDNAVTSICAPPTVWRMLIQEDLASYPVALRSTCGAGEPLNPEIIQAVERAWGLPLRDGFGQTETTAQIGNSPGQLIKPGAVGRPLPGYNVVLLDADDKEASEGEIALRLDSRPAGLMSGYLGEDGKVEPVTGSYYRTGDVASQDEEGWYTYVGRADDVFKASDYRISPFELESILIEHPAVLEAAVVPAPDPVRLAVPKAFITLSASAQPTSAVARDIFQHISEKIAPFKRIRRIEFGELPKTISGKIRRVELRRLEVERFSTATRGAMEFREEDFHEG